MDDMKEETKMNIAQGYYSVWGDGAAESCFRAGVYCATDEKHHGTLNSIFKIVDRYAEHTEIDTEEWNSIMKEIV